MLDRDEGVSAFCRGEDGQSCGLTARCWESHDYVLLLMPGAGSQGGGNSSKPPALEGVWKVACVIRGPMFGWRHRRLDMARRGYPTDLTGAQWAALEPHLPAARTGGRPRRTDLRAVIDATLYLLRTGCQWRLIPFDFPPWRTVW